MCGIAGLLSTDGRPLPDARVLDAMCAAIVHRGPDDQGLFIGPWAQIGMRRLSIIDVAGGHQPIGNETGSVQVVFNGEIYNFRELRRELEALGHRFATQSDTECIVHAWEQYGPDCFARLRGMFAIAIIDHDRQELILARDRIGKKPLYYGEVAPGILAFGSEIKCLLQVPGIEPTMSIDAVHDYFTFGYVPAPGSILRGISKLPAGHWLRLDGRGRLAGRLPTPLSYHRVAFEPKLGGNASNLEDQLLAHLDDAVQARLVSDVPFGAFLSGGLDSSVVCALMARHLTQPLKTFTIGFADAAFDELPDARRVSDYLGTEHHELVVTPDAVGLLNELNWYFDEPFGDSSAIPTFLVSRLAASKVTMVLSGDGGDELFAGYSRYRRYQLLARAHRASLGLAPLAGRWIAPLLPAPLGPRVGRIADRLGLPWPDDYLSTVALANRDDLRLLFGNAAPADPYASLRPAFGRTDIAEPMERILAGDMLSYLTDDILVKVDRASMANSLEARAPLLDQQLIDFVARLPFDQKLRGGEAKYLFKRVAARLLPASVLAKRKQGFAIPLAGWFREALRPMLLDTLGSQSFRERGLFDSAGVQTLIDQHLSGQIDRGELLWMLVTFELWARRFLGNPATAAPAPRHRVVRTLTSGVGG